MPFPRPFGTAALGRGLWQELMPDVVVQHGRDFGSGPFFPGYLPMSWRGPARQPFSIFSPCRQIPPRDEVTKKSPAWGGTGRGPIWPAKDSPRTPRYGSTAASRGARPASAVRVDVWFNAVVTRASCYGTGFFHARKVTIDRLIPLRRQHLVTSTESSSRKTELSLNTFLGERKTTQMEPSNSEHFHYFLAFVMRF